MQGIVYRPGDVRFARGDLKEALADRDCVMVNRNRGSGTRALIDGLLGTARPAGFLAEARSHNAVCAAVAQGRADWGVAIAPVAAAVGLGFWPLVEERYDFVVPRRRRERPAVRAFAALLREPAVREGLQRRGFGVADSS